MYRVRGDRPSFRRNSLRRDSLRLNESPRERLSEGSGFLMIDPDYHGVVPLENEEEDKEEIKEARGEDFHILNSTDKTFVTYRRHQDPKRLNVPINIVNSNCAFIT